MSATPDIGEKAQVVRVDDLPKGGATTHTDEESEVPTAVNGEDHKGVDDDSLPDYDDAEVKRIVRKIDYRLPPIFALLYLISFLDRTNIGNAKVAGMTKDLHMTGKQYNIALTSFFFPYACGMIPSNLVLKKVSPCAWISFLMVSWGFCMTMHGQVKTFQQLCVVRALLGLCEAGFFPAASYLLTLWYCRFEYQFRVALFYSCASLAGAFSGLLAYGIMQMDGVGDRAGWRWIFYLEGIFTVLCGVVVYFIMPNSPASASWLTPAEKDVIHRRLHADAGTKEGHVTNEDAFTIRAVTHTLMDWKLWAWGIIICGQSIPLYAFTFYAPSIIKELGYKSWQAQLLTVPVYLVACAATILVAVWADRRRTRWKFIAYPYSISAIGFVALLAIPHPKLPGLTYAFMYLIPLGLYSGLTALIAWVANNLAPSWRRAVGQAFVPALANCGGAIGANIYLQREAPRYWLGFGFSLGVLVAAIATVFITKHMLVKINAERDKITVQEVREKYTEDDLLALGDRGPLYRYVV